MSPPIPAIKRRHVVIGAGLGALLVRPARATPESMRAAIAAFTRGAPVRSGRVAIDIASIIDNGNAVPVTLRVDSPMTAADHVQQIAFFNERNPNPEIAVFHLSPRNGRAVVSTRVRLATSQQLVALARMSDGSLWQNGVDVLVALAACIEG